MAAAPTDREGRAGRADRSRLERWLPIAATAVFFVVGLIGILRHEMWRDEIEIWMIATASSSLAELKTNIRTQPHPPLWYLLTWLASRLTSDPRAIQVLSLLVGTTTAYLFLTRAPLPALHRVLFCFGYFPLYEYTIISRSYGLDLLFAVAFCALYSGRRPAIDGGGAEGPASGRRAHPDRYPWLAATLVLLANVHLLGTVIAGLLFLVLAWDAVPLVRRGLAGRRVAWSLAAAAAGIVFGLSEGLLGAWHMGTEHTHQAATIGAGGVTDAVSSIYYAYLPIPDIFERRFWNSNAVTLLPVDVGKPLAVGLAVALFILCAAALRRSRVLLALYVAGVLAMLAVFTEKSSGYLRHYGHLAILFVALLWLASVREPVPDPPPDGPPGSPARLDGVRPPSSPPSMRRVASLALTLVLALHVAVAAFAFAVDFAHPFSGSADGARFLVANGLDDAVLVGSLDYTAQPYAGYLGKSIYYPDQRRFGTFMTWGPEREVVRYKQVLREAARLERESSQDVVLILDYNPRLGAKGGRCRVDEELELELLSSFQCAIVREESYWLGVLRRSDAPVDGPVSSSITASESSTPADESPPDTAPPATKVKPCVSPRAAVIGPEVELSHLEPDEARPGRHRRNARRRLAATLDEHPWELHRRQGLRLAACDTEPY